MATNSTTEFDSFEGFSDDNVSLQYEVDNKDGIFYDLHVSDTSDNISIKFYDKDHFDILWAMLEKMYSFVETKDKTGMTTTITFGAKKVVITAYSTKTLLIQGHGCRLWKSKIFKKMSEQLNHNLTDDSSSINWPERSLLSASNDSQPSANNSNTSQTSLKTVKRKRSGILSTVASFFHSTPKEKVKKSWKSSTPVNSTSFLTYPYINTSVGPTSQNQIIESNMSRKTPEQPTTSSTPVKPTSFSPRTYIINPGRPTNQKQPSESNISRKIPVQPKKSSTPVNSTSFSPRGYIITPGRPTNQKQPSESNMSRKPPLQSRTSSTLTKLNGNHHNVSSGKTTLTTEKSDFLIHVETQTADATGSELKPAHLNETSKSTTSDYNATENQEIKEKNKKLSELKAELLIQEEEVIKLKQTIQSLKKENKQLRGELTAERRNKENDHSIQTDVGDIKRQLSEYSDILDLLKSRTEDLPSKTDIYLLRNDVAHLKKEINENTINQDVSPKQPTQTMVTNSQQTNNKPSETTTEQRNKTQSESVQPKSKQKPNHVLILGDSVTKGLLKDKMSNHQTTVTIRSHRGATVSDLTAAIDNSKSRPNVTQDVDVIIIHAGINNISNADQPTDICNEFDELTTKLRTLNPKSHLMISSILQKKRDLLSTENIKNTNVLLEKFCKEKKIHFINNSNIIMKNGKVDQTLYYDEVHLNSQGSAVLGRQLNAAIRNTLNPDSDISLTSGNFRNVPHKNHRDPHWRHRQNNRGHPAWRRWPVNPWMPVGPPMW